MNLKSIYSFLFFEQRYLGQFIRFCFEIDFLYVFLRFFLREACLKSLIKVLVFILCPKKWVTFCHFVQYKFLHFIEKKLGPKSKF